MATKAKAVSATKSKSGLDRDTLLRFYRTMFAARRTDDQEQNQTNEKEARHAEQMFEIPELRFHPVITPAERSNVPTVVSDATTT